jgi:hypothetical protein
MKKPGVPALPPQPSTPMAEYLRAIQSNLEIVTGRRGGRIGELPANASNAEVIAKINEILRRLQD